MYTDTWKHLQTASCCAGMPTSTLVEALNTVCWWVRVCACVFDNKTRIIYMMYVNVYGNLEALLFKGPTAVCLRVHLCVVKKIRIIYK